MDPQTAQAAGLKPADRQFLDISQAPRFKEPRRISDKLLTKEQTAVMTPQVAAQFAGQDNGGTVLPFPQGMPQPQPASQAPQMAPQQAILMPGAQAPPTPPVLPNDSPRVQDRISKLYGAWKSAEERALESDQRLAAVLARIEGRLSPGPSGDSFFQATPPPAPPQISSPYPEPVGPGTEKPLTRSELFSVLQQHTQELQKVSLLASSQAASRVEAERDFPDVFADPQLRQHAEYIRQRDYPHDPSGPYKAAALARGLALPVGGAPLGNGASSAILRKQELMGIGPSVPEGTGTSNDPFARYNEALQIARASGREEDLVRLRLIQQGLL